MHCFSALGLICIITVHIVNGVMFKSTNYCLFYERNVAAKADNRPKNKIIIQLVKFVTIGKAFALVI